MIDVTLDYPCVCCGHLTLGEPPGSYEICPVCGWEDDPVQLRWPDWPGGANKPSLITAQQNYRRYGAKEERVLKHVRRARVDEGRDPGWRPIDPQQDHFEPHGVKLAEWPDDPTVLYWWRYSDTGFWRESRKSR